MTGTLPAHDLDAEQAILAAVICDSSCLAELEGLPPEAFFEARHRHIWAAILGCAEAGTPIDDVTVSGWLKARDRILDAGGVPYIGHVVSNIASIHNVAAYGQLVMGHWRRRKAVAKLETLTAKLKTGVVGVEAAVELAAELEALGAGQKASPVRSAGDIFKPLEAIPWLCKGLAIGPGRPTILSGYGGIGKTFAAQALALTVAAGLRRLWDVHEVQHEGGPVLHLDYEQGQWITDWRYQRLARSLGLGPEQLGGLATIHYPDFYLTSPDAERRLVKLCTGRALLLIDSLRAACPGVDENDSAMGSYLYLLARVSEKTKCVVVVIHHEGKTSGENPRQGIERLRGSSAIAAGAGSVVSFVKAENGCIRVEHTRANLGEAAESELVRLVDEGEVDPVTGKSVGIRIEWIPKDQLRQEAAEQDDEQHEAALRALCARALACVQRAQRTVEGMRGARQLRALLHISDLEARRVWEYLASTGAIVSNGKGGKAARWHTPDAAPGGTSEGTEEGSADDE